MPELPIETPLRFWIYCHGGTGWYTWRVLSQTNDEATARWLYDNARAMLRQGAVRLIDVETSMILEEGEHDTNPPAARPPGDRADRQRL
jgi:hypothetical protein